MLKTLTKSLPPRVWSSWLQYLVLWVHFVQSSGPTQYPGPAHFFQLYIMFWFVICDCNIRVVVGMGAQGLFILGFSLSVEVTFTFLSKSYLVHIMGKRISLSDCWNARRPSLLAMDLLQSPCRHFHPHSLCHWPGLIMYPSRLSVFVFQIVDCNKIVSVFVNIPRLSIYHVF